MISELINNITYTLYNFFNVESEIYKIYANQVPQDFQQPSFYVKLLSASKTGARAPAFYYSINNFDIQYYPTGYERQLECSQMADKLYECLEWLEPENINGLNMSATIVDNVLHFFVTYKLTEYKPLEHGEEMEELTLTQKLKKQEA